MNVDSILLSDYAQAMFGKLTVVGVFDRVPAEEVPVTLSQMTVSLVIHGHSAEAGTTHELEIWLLNQRRERLNPVPFGQPFTFAGPEHVTPGIPLRVVIVQGILMPTFPEFGPYAFEVYIDGTYHTAAALYVGPASG